MVLEGLGRRTYINTFLHVSIIRGVATSALIAVFGSRVAEFDVVGASVLGFRLQSLGPEAPKP